MTSFIINCRNCNDDPICVSLSPGHTRLTCPKDEKSPSILDLMRSNGPQNIILLQNTKPVLTRSQNKHFTPAEQQFCRDSFDERLLAVIKIQKFVKKFIIKMP